MGDKIKSKIKADLKKNRLYITVCPTVTKADLQKMYTDVRFVVADLKPGFDVITDYSQCTFGYIDGLSIMKKIMEFLAINEMGRAIRIVGDTSIAFKQLLAIASKFQSYKPIYVNTLEEAEEELICPIKPNGLRFQINQRQIQYSIDQEEGTGYLVDISISGCAVQEPTMPLSPDAEVSITIPLHQELDVLSPFTMVAKVVWVRGDRFAVQFLDLDDDRKALLYKGLVNEGRIEIA